MLQSLRASLLVAAALFACGGAAAAKPLHPPKPRPAPAAKPAPPKPSAAVARIVTYDMLGAQTAYLEHQVGPAMYVDGLTRTYRIDACKVAVVVDEHQAIRSFDMTVTPRCTFDLNQFLSQRHFGPLADMTFGEFDAKAGPGAYWSDCLTLCGNDADPSVFDHYAGPHADNFVEVQVGVVLTGDAAIAAAQGWAKAMTAADGAAYVQALKFNCEARHQGVAREAFRAVRITRVSVGYGLPEPPGCQPPQAATPAKH